MTTGTTLKLQAANASWELWFKDLPTTQAAEDSDWTFESKNVQSPQRRGVNDPSAGDPKYIHRTSYEWRLADGRKSDYLRLGPFRFYPLSLERLVLGAAGSASELSLVGRLQLPLWNGDQLHPAWQDEELTDLDSAVTLFFENGNLARIEPAKPDVDAGEAIPVSAVKRWALAHPLKQPDGPMLAWESLKLENDQIILDAFHLVFSHLGVRWAVANTAPLTIPISGAAADITFDHFDVGVIVAFLFLLGVAVCSLTPVPYRAWNRLRARWAWLLLLLVVLLSYGCIIVYCHHCPLEMPFSWSEGISIWPTEILRLFAAVLGLYLLFYSSSRLADNQYALSRMFMIDSSPPGHGQTSAGTPASVPDSITNRAESPDASTHDLGSRKGRLVRFGAWLANGWERRCQHGIARWRETSDTNQGRAETEPLDGATLWKEYCGLGLPTNRWLRCIPAAVAYLLAIVGMMWLLGFPVQPHRGPLSWGANFFALVLSIVVFILVTAYVIDATRLCKRFINILVQRTTKWPDALLNDWKTRLGLEGGYLDEWLDMRFIATLTEAVGQLIWWPLLLLALLVVARNPFFANFDWPMSLWLVLGLNTAFVVGYAVQLRRAARAARDVELERLRLKSIKAEKEEEGTAEQIRQLVKEIEDMTGGAFAPLSADPIVHAVLVAVSGVSIPTILAYLNVAHW